MIKYLTFDERTLMKWRIASRQPSRKQYKQFEQDLSKKSSPDVIESGVLVFLTMLFLIPLTGLLLACAIGMFGEQISGLGRGAILLGCAGVSAFQAQRGLVRRKVRLFPKNHIQNETAHVGGKASEFATGRDAVVVGVFFLAAAVACLSMAQRVLLGSF
jgi:uncharacterized membrane protein